MTENDAGAYKRGTGWVQDRAWDLGLPGGHLKGTLRGGFVSYRVKGGKALAEVVLPGDSWGPVRSPHEGPEKQN